MVKTAIFLKILSELPNPELDSFWRFVAEQMKGLSGNDPLRTALSEADTELKTGRDRPRPMIGGVLKLPGDQLRQVVLKHRECLIPFVEECYNWKATIATWILKTRQDQLIKVLDALGCPHNGKCSRWGNPPELTPEQATERITALSSEISFDDLTVVIAGLISNHDDWNYLDSTLERLRDETQRARETTQVMTQDPEPIPMTPPPLSNNLAVQIEALRAKRLTRIRSGFLIRKHL